MDEDNNPTVVPVGGIATENDEERSRRESEDRARREERNDSLVREVHENHKLPSGTETPEERKKLLEHYIQLPDDPKYAGARLLAQRPAGEILVTLYNHILRLDTEDDDNDDDGEGGGRETPHPQGGPTRRLSGENERETPTCKVVPLQWLYDIPDDGTPPKMVTPPELFSYLPKPTNVGGGNLRVIEFPTPYYADNFLKTMRDISLETLINDSRTTIEKVGAGPTTDFLKGVAFYPNIPPRQFVSPVRSFYSRKTLIFVAIPYLGQESLSRAHFRKKAQPVPGIDHSKDGVAKALTAYQFIDKDATDTPPSNSSLNLLEYKFPSKTGSDGLDELQEELEIESKGEVTTVHQVWFMVFDNETIAAFRSADDVESDSLPLFPWQRQTEGAYHGLINMINNILPLAEPKILKSFSQKVTDFEFSVQTRNGRAQASNGNNLALKMKIANFELSSAADVVGAQIDILQSLGEFNVDENPEQFVFVRETVEAAIAGRKSFLSKMNRILQKLQDTQQTLRECLSKEEAEEHRRVVGEHLDKVREAAEASKHAAEASRAAAEEGTKAAEAGRAAAEDATRAAKSSQTAAEEGTKAAEASRTAAEQARMAAEASNNAAQESKDASRQTTEAALASAKVSEGNAKQTEGQSVNIFIFTLITAIFTPMSFTTSYWGMNVQGIRETSWSQREYWELTAPLTVFILFIGWLVGFPRPGRFRPIIPKRFHDRIYGIAGDSESTLYQQTAKDRENSQSPVQMPELPAQNGGQPPDISSMA